MAYMLYSAVLRPVRLIRKLPAHDGIVRTCPIHHTAHINLHRNRPSISHIDRPAIVRKSEIQLLSHISMERCRRRIKRSILPGCFRRYISAMFICSLACCLDQRINAKLEQIMQLRSLSQRYTVAFGGEHVSHTRNVSSMEDVVIKIVML